MDRKERLPYRATAASPQRRKCLRHRVAVGERYHHTSRLQTNHPRGRAFDSIGNGNGVVFQSNVPQKSFRGQSLLEPTHTQPLHYKLKRIVCQLLGLRAEREDVTPTTLLSSVQESIRLNVPSTISSDNSEHWADVRSP